jgi:RNA polymerase sigma factor (sigma-70 family)
MNRTPTTILSELLVLNAQRGDEESLSELVEFWTPRLRARAHRLTRDHEGAGEVLQESWVGIARGLRRLRDPALFGAWAMRIVHHKSADWIRARARDRAMDPLHDEGTIGESPSTEIDRAQTIRTAIGQLDRNLRDVVYLFYMDNCTLKQVSVVLDIPIGTAKSRLARARDQLRPILEQTLERSTP